MVYLLDKLPIFIDRKDLYNLIFTYSEVWLTLREFNGANDALVCWKHIRFSPIPAIKN